MKMHYFKDLFEYELVRSNRKTVGIIIKTGGEVCIKAPYGMSRKEIEAGLERKQSWILQNIAKMKEQGEKILVKSYETGEKLLYLGQEFTLVRKPSISGSRVYVRQEEDTIAVYGNLKQAEQVKAALEKWYQQKAVIWMTKRLNYYKERIGVQYKKVSFKNPKTRWGSCSSTKNIMLNWKLIMAPGEIIDYVICHELCHLLEMNHSSAFWALVEQQIPDWRTRRAWLKENGMMLSV